jgi:hypothetical protein
MVEAQLHLHFGTTLAMGVTSPSISGSFSILHTKIGQFPLRRSHFLHSSTIRHGLLESCSQDESIDSEEKGENADLRQYLTDS